MTHAIVKWHSVDNEVFVSSAVLLAALISLTVVWFVYHITTDKGHYADKSTRVAIRGLKALKIITSIAIV